MKRLILTIMCAVIMIMQGRSQTLTNTTWIAYDSTNTAGYFYQFSADTLSYSYNNIIYSPLSVYSQSGSIITIVDVDTLFCASGVTGNYELIFKGGDTLQFSLISDSCTARSDYLVTHNFVQIYTGINFVDNFSHINAFPNPFDDRLSFNIDGNNHVELTLYDISMRKVIQLSFTNSTSVSTAHLSSGIYFYTLKNDDGFVANGRVVRQ